MTALEQILVDNGVGSMWWKRANDGSIALDCKIGKGLDLAAKFLNVPDVSVEILCVIPDEDYIEIGIKLNESNSNSMYYITTKRLEERG